MLANKNDFNKSTREELWEKKERSRDRALRNLQEKTTLTIPIVDSPVSDPISVLVQASDLVFMMMDNVANLHIQLDDLDNIMNSTLDLIDQALLELTGTPSESPIFEQRKRLRRK